MKFEAFLARVQCTQSENQIQLTHINSTLQATDLLTLDGQSWAVEYIYPSNLKEPCKKYTALTAERLPRVDPIPKI